ncbi:MAG: hypothetical protein GY868_19900 [Deltaproteobacteria bacterium]|nr:hypothetical protein [Deltaproteobacteria bacterium]
MSDEPSPEQGSPLDAVLKRTSAAFGLLSVVFSAAGFLAVRSSINGLGVPSQAALSLDEYLQFGGRFFFTVTVHMLPICAIVYLLYLLGLGCSKLLKQKRSAAAGDLATSLVLAGFALVSIFFELILLGREPVFQPGSTYSMAAHNIDLLILLMLEAVAAGTLIWFCIAWHRFRQRLSRPGPARPLPVIAGVLIVIQLLLLPVCFGRVAMVPEQLPEVRLQVKGSARATPGILVFSDANHHYLWLEDNHHMIQINKKEVTEIRYEGSRDIVKKTASPDRP